MSAGRPGTLLSGAVLFGLVLLNLHPIGSLPAPGPLLDPVRGIWSTTRSAELPESASGTIAGLREAVEVHYDRRGVAHIFASNEADAVRSLGYVVARDRLFQMEVQARAGAGSLAELVGAAALPLDREIRQLGMPDGARRNLARLDPHERELLEAFSAGVNAWIDAHAARDVPLEYHLLGRRPRRWTPLHSLDIISRMGYVLALSDLERTVEQARSLLGPTVGDALYPRNSPIQVPVQPNGEGAPRFSTQLIPPPPEVAAARPGGSAGRQLAGNDSVVLPLGSFAVEPPSRRAADALGSNNWAVAPKRTEAGHALLAGDQHLELTLPAIWYEVHLKVADSLDVYGVTIPGVPTVVIGFSRAVAWTFTNTEADVLDLYQETVD
ncbi:MAG TPA: penicillin acylase family protein, partial [Gemmatimonadales bacterium]|nr:penicillin acylase family protein [Gemmatimonadales bacterium]